MVRILRVVSVSRGFDPRRFVLMAHGGAGPLHAGDLAEELGVGRIVIPPDPGLFSAMGLIISDVQTVASATRFLPADAANLPAIRESLAAQTAQCNETLSEEGFAPQDQIVERFLEMRYVRQNFELEVPVSGVLESEAELDEVLKAFHDMHLQSYGHSDPDAPVEVVNVKCRAAGLVPKPRRALLPSGGADPSDAFIGRRRVFFKGSGWLECPHYDRVKLLRGNVIRGPAMVCQFDSSVTILPGHVATAGSMGELVIDTGKGEVK
jgi:N-methylhydantoinase A